MKISRAECVNREGYRNYALPHCLQVQVSEFANRVYADKLWVEHLGSLDILRPMLCTKNVVVNHHSLPSVSVLGHMVKLLPLLRI